VWAGPFCNLTNPVAIATLASFGFKGAIVGPELGEYDYQQLPKKCMLPLGIVIAGSWPLCISRIFSEDLKTEIPFSSPKGEQAWGRRYGSNYWIYPNWKLDLSAQKKALQKAGYKVFIHLMEPIPREVTLKKRPGLWNWKLELL
jgi:putative protease